MIPRYPIYVISKGRAESRLTVRALDRIKTPHRVVIEPQEYDAYAAVIPKERLLVLPFSNLGQGSIPARNFVWAHAASEGAEKFWQLDDNLRKFAVLNRNKKTVVTDGAIFQKMERFADLYENVALAGPQYWMFAPARQGMPPAIFNTRIYSCILIKTDLPFQFRGRYNEDTDLSLRCLKAGFCTILFNAFLQEKMTTMTMRGGNEEIYAVKDARLLMAESLRDQHPDVTKITWKFRRWQHHVDYRPFKLNKLILKGKAAA